MSKAFVLFGGIAILMMFVGIWNLGVGGNSVPLGRLYMEGGTIIGYVAAFFQAYHMFGEPLPAWD